MFVDVLDDSTSCILVLYSLGFRRKSLTFRASEEHVVVQTHPGELSSEKQTRRILGRNNRNDPKMHYF